MEKSNPPQTQFVSILEKIPIFRGLTSQQGMKILGICVKKGYSKKAIVCRAGEESNEMYILLKGILQVTLSDGKELFRIHPIGIVGEMGVFTGERRSANVLVMNDSILMIIHKQELFKLFRDDSELGIRILVNVIRDLSKKLRKNNEIIEALKKICPPGEAKLVISKTLLDTEEYRRVRTKPQ